MAIFYWDPQRVFITLKGIPILWYGLLFAIGFWLGAQLFRYNLIFSLSSSNKELPLIKREATKYTDALTIWMVVATIVGARVGHLLFYQEPSLYLQNPLIFFKLREGGLSSHGAAFIIIPALFLFTKYKKKLSFLQLLDLVVISTSLAAVFIRLGNFCNQELLGTPYHGPLSVVFGHPLDGSMPIARHPVQLYEAFSYLAIFVFLFFGGRKKEQLHIPGRIFSLFLILLFAARFLLEFYKQEKGMFSIGSINTAQILSLPLILLGVVLLIRTKANISKSTPLS